MTESVVIRIAILGTLFAVIIAIVASMDAGGSQRDLITLSDSNTVSLNVPIDGESIRAVEKELLERSDKMGKNEDMYLVLNTPGGSVSDGLEFIQLIKGLPQHVHTISLFSASMGFIISQYLDTRYVMDNSTLMSHRAAAEGMGGQIGGSLNTRINFLNEQILDVERTVASRSGYPLPKYQAMIADEMWLGGADSVKLKFADKVVRVRCDKTLRGPGNSRTVQFFIFRAEVTYDKCPLITTPSIVMGDKYLVELLQKDKRTQVRMFNQ